MKPNTFLRIVRGSAWYDLLVTWPFALPWTFAWVYTQIELVAARIGMPGITPPLDSMHMLFANLLGSVVVIWSLARILSPTVQLGRLDAVARLLFLSWQIDAVTSGASLIILAFSIFEFSFGILQSLPVRRTAEEAPTDPNRRGLTLGLPDVPCRSAATTVRFSSN